MTFLYKRNVCFRDTDAAGVVYFANVLAICHEAYEASLAVTGIDLKVFFSQKSRVIPIVHASVDFLRPMFCGDRLSIELQPQLLSDREFEIDYKIFADSISDVEAAQSRQVLSKATTRHVCIDPVARSRQELPSEIKQWWQRWCTNP